MLFVGNVNLTHRVKSHPVVLRGEGRLREASLLCKYPLTCRVATKRFDCLGRKEHTYFLLWLNNRKVIKTKWRKKWLSQWKTSNKSASIVKSGQGSCAVGHPCSSVCSMCPMCRGCVLARVQIRPVSPLLQVKRSKAMKMPLKKVVHSERSRSISSPMLNTSGNLPSAPFHSGLKKNLLTPANIWLLSSVFKWLCITGIYRLQLWSADTWCPSSNAMSWRSLNVCELKARFRGFFGDTSATHQRTRITESLISPSLRAQVDISAKCKEILSGCSWDIAFTRMGRTDLWIHVHEAMGREWIVYF